MSFDKFQFRYALNVIVLMIKCKPPDRVVIYAKLSGDFMVPRRFNEKLNDKTLQ